MTSRPSSAALLAAAIAFLPVAGAAAPKTPAAPTEAPALPDDANKIAEPFAVFSGLDKITGRIISFDVAIDETVQFGALQVTPRVCYSRPQTVAPLTDSFVEVDEITLDNKIRRIFSGWMFADSPGLHAVDHPVYDVWLTDCRSSTEEAAAKKAAAQPQPTEDTTDPATDASTPPVPAAPAEPPPARAKPPAKPVTTAPKPAAPVGAPPTAAPVPLVPAN
ncbi:MAG: DUF2155 domain-containing protein [Phyllobacteriaceae bacterium]|nr:DUF2155 domain-containing protein [Phyllobacteriaceae bacterium]